VWGLLLSNNDIKRELVKAKNMSIHPLIIDNIKGSSINLTASKYAWKVSDKNSAVVDNKIIIPPNDTVCIYTQEAIWVSRRLGGTYHPRVSLVSKGLGHISTTLDPQYKGLSLVAVPNHTSSPIEIRLEEPFVSIMLYYLESPATTGIIENAASRPEISRGFNLGDEEESYLGQQWHRNHEGIKNKMLASQTYINLEKEKLKFRRGLLSFLNQPLVSGIIGGTIVGIIIYALRIN